MRTKTALQSKLAPIRNDCIARRFLTVGLLRICSRIIVDSAPPADLPNLQYPDQCSRCFSARECMTYAAAGSLNAEGNQKDVQRSHKDILEQYTGHLSDNELEYFRTWDRLIDLEADATKSSVAEAWLEKSEDLERRNGKSISSLSFIPRILQQNERSQEEQSVAFIVFERSTSSVLRTPLSKLKLQSGTFVTCSSDCTSQDVLQAKYSLKPSVRQGNRAFRHQMKVFRGTVERTEGDNKIVIRTSEASIGRMNDLVARFKDSTPVSTSSSPELLFRIDHDDSYSINGTLRRNVLDLLTKDKAKVDNPTTGDGAGMGRLRIQRRFRRQRELIIHLKPPQFSVSQQEEMFNYDSHGVPSCDAIDLMVEFSTTMNGDQRAAAQKVRLLVVLPSESRLGKTAYSFVVYPGCIDA
jgi:hypothetical protein